MNDLTHYAVLADVFQYPSDGYPTRVRLVRAQIADRWPKAAVELDRFIDLLPEEVERWALTTLRIMFVKMGSKPTFPRNAMI